MQSDHYLKATTTKALTTKVIMLRRITVSTDYTFFFLHDDLEKAEPVYQIFRLRKI